MGRMQFAPTRVPDKLPCLGRGRPYMYQAKFAGGLETPLANAFPAWNLARRSLLMQTNATAWDKN